MLLVHRIVTNIGNFDSLVYCYVFARVCLSVLLERLLKNACMNLDEMLRVGRCWDMDELVNF